MRHEDKEKCIIEAKHWVIDGFIDDSNDDILKGKTRVPPGSPDGVTDIDEIEIRSNVGDEEMEERAAEAADEDTGNKRQKKSVIIEIGSGSNGCIWYQVNWVMRILATYVDTSSLF